jgi:hypothetical protein
MLFLHMWIQAVVSGVVPGSSFAFSKRKLVGRAWAVQGSVAFVGRLSGKGTPSVSVRDRLL